jgi:hypothetical protein
MMKVYRPILFLICIWSFPIHVYAHGLSKILPFFYILMVIFIGGPIIAILLTSKKYKLLFLIGVLTLAVIDILLFNSADPIFGLIVLPFPALITLIYFLISVDGIKKNK